jgi:hypothetical protein
MVPKVNNTLAMQHARNAVLQLQASANSVHTTHAAC